MRSMSSKKGEIYERNTIKVSTPFKLAETCKNVVDN